MVTGQAIATLVPIASQTDSDGYKVSIYPILTPTEDDIRVNRVWRGVARHGLLVIQPPDIRDACVPSLYWMNWPEKSWGISDEAWKQMSIHERAGLEVQQQATAYQPLRVQYEDRRKLASNEVRLRSIFPRDFSFTVHSANPAGARNIKMLLDNFIRRILRSGVMSTKGEPSP